MTIEDTVIKLIGSLKDPLLDLTGKEMNLQYKITTSNQAIHVVLTAGYPTSLLETSYKPIVQKIVQDEFPNYQVTISIQQFIKAHKTQLTGKALRGVKNTIAVASGKGGVGKSTVTVNLAAALAKLGARVGILDADIYGPSIPLMLGETKPVQVKDNCYIPVEAHGMQAMSIGYLTDTNQALIWRGPMLAKSLIQMLDITLWNELDYLFIDLPPGTGDIQLTLVQKIPLTSAIVVTTPQNVATLDAQKAITMFSRTGIDVLGIIENMSTHICSHCGHQEAIFGRGGAAALCDAYQCTLLGQLPLDSHVRKHCDEGVPTATHSSNQLTDTFIKTAMRTAIELSKKPINYADRFPKIVVE
ncbi:TPA: iron-sulfur cluster carrier protein ApbC [Legionella pneumophila]|uniref:iron-sulfur cluster carrier protein ApbC n=1 Tax=Legionella pneumophila TaxID=446 RepID=UPI001374F1A6|nr:iron-sulfur cluster carrier protein ApbC [Legionella pneumophila]HAT2147556.1 iron-sulfur cluster carrier protein ApbC [Legionella pneumophila]HAT2150714.1 iron-sulfur cluster carrier protein ApbC [Legionella pneumophila]HAT3882738.1 iron-sulfur cluster carrier protein ApbC [Legionella pneumophila]HAT8334091.1 iron-sulfur cluster carrier protein ApbC [Legionella pneumophila]HAT8728474.1 iron-sulfur cluster carrier protein ApbC [Legionella pneumophila]